MTLQAAATATAASGAAAIQPRSALDSLTMTAIDQAISAASTGTNLDERTYKAIITFNADINGRTKPVEIIQSDATRIFLKGIVDALEDAGYRTAFTLKSASRQGGQDRITLTVAWD